MTTQELKNYINSKLGNSLRTLLPSYWWKRLFGLVVDKVDEVNSRIEVVSTFVQKNTVYIPIEGGVLSDEMIKQNARAVNGIKRIDDIVFVFDGEEQMRSANLIFSNGSCLRYIDGLLLKESTVYLDGSVETTVIESFDSGVEIREFRIGDSLTDEDKAWNLETLELVNQNKCTVVYTVTETLDFIALGTVIPVSLFSSNGCAFTYSLGAHGATWEIAISDDGSASLSTIRVTIDNSLSTESTNPVRNKVITAALNEKQATLVSGTNIKTINGTSILGSGNIEIEGGGTDITVDSALSTTSTNPVQNKVIKAELDNKVDVVSGKQLSTEDFTTALKTKLEGLSNYDDTEISNALTSLETQIDTLVSGDASAAIESFNEITAFLNGVEDTESLDGIIAGIEQQITNKQDTIADLETIRNGAALGATALQEHQDISHLATKEELTSLTNEMMANEEVTAAALNELNERINEISENVSGETATKVELQTAVESLTNTILENEEITAAALNDLNERINEILTKLRTLENIND